MDIDASAVVMFALALATTLSRFWLLAMAEMKRAPVDQEVAGAGRQIGERRGMGVDD